MNIACNNIKKTYGSVKALQSASITVNSGEVHALLGGNGSGKSTLAKILGGSVKKDSGDIILGGKSASISSPEDSRRLRIIMTSQELSLLNNLSVAENLSLCQLPKKNLFVDRRKVQCDAETLLEKYGMLHLLNKRIQQLPPNEQYLVEFFKALIQEPEVLLIDEITSALYTKDVKLVKTIIDELKAKGCAILFISHRLDEIFSICDTVTIMRNGSTIKSYAISETNEDELLAEMVGEERKEIEKEKELIREGHTYDPGGRKVLLSLKDFAVEDFDSEIDLTIYEGEVVGIAGLQGHGQSTLLRQLFGLYRPARVTLDGTETCIDSVQSAIEHRIGFISGDREKEGVFSEQTLTDNVNVVNKIIYKQKKDNSYQLLKDNKVVFASVKQKITELSGGNQQKVVISRWTSAKPLILLADDPTKGIDVKARSDVHQMMYGLAEHGSAVLMVSSDDYELVTLAEHAQLAKIIVMYEGQIVRVLKGAEINVDNIASSSLGIAGKEVS